MANKLINNEIFYCEPLLANEENLRLIQKFHVAAETGLGLEIYLKKYAVSDELSHEARTYLVKDNMTNEIVGYFSRFCIANHKNGSRSSGNLHYLYFCVAIQ